MATLDEALGLKPPESLSGFDERPPEDSPDAFVMERGVEEWGWGCCAIHWKTYLDRVTLYYWVCGMPECGKFGSHKYARQKAIKGAIAHSMREHALDQEPDKA